MQTHQVSFSIVLWVAMGKLPSTFFGVELYKPSSLKNQLNQNTAFFPPDHNLKFNPWSHSGCIIQSSTAQLSSIESQSPEFCPSCIYPSQFCGGELWWKSCFGVSFPCLGCQHGIPNAEEPKKCSSFGATYSTKHLGKMCLGPKCWNGSWPLASQALVSTRFISHSLTHMLPKAGVLS